MTVSRLTQEKIRTLEVSQDECYIKLDFTTQNIELHRHSNIDISTSKSEIKYKQESTIEKLFIHKENPLQLEIEYFISHIRENESSYSSNQYDLETLKLTQKIMQIVKKDRLSKSN